jgi:hypothetical protein
MKYDRESATTVGTVVFGVFCIFVAMAGIVYVASLNNQTTALTDTYGNTQSVVTNASQSATIAMTAEEEASMVPLVLLVSAVGLCCIIFIVWVWSKGGISV